MSQATALQLIWPDGYEVFSFRSFARLFVCLLNQEKKESHVSCSIVVFSAFAYILLLDSKFNVAIALQGFK